MAIQAILTPLAAMFESSNHAVLKSVAGTNAPVFSLGFDDAATWDAFWMLPAHEYGGDNLRFRLVWHAENATTGVVRWGIQLSALSPNTDTTSIESRSFGTAVEVNDTHLGTTSERVHSVDLDLDSAAELDNLAADDEVVVRIYREGDDAGDTLANDAELDRVEVFEFV